MVRRLMLAFIFTSVVGVPAVIAQGAATDCSCSTSEGGHHHLPAALFLPLLALLIPSFGGGAPPGGVALPPAAPVAPAPGAPAVLAPGTPAVGAPTVAVPAAMMPLVHGLKAPNTATIIPSIALLGVVALLLAALLQIGRHRRIGFACVTVGSALLLIAALNYTRAAISRERARSLWAEIDARPAQPPPGQSARAATVSFASAGPPFLGSPVARLRIPAIALDEVVVEGIDDDALDAGPGHYPGTALPGEPGNAIISAHRDRQFHRLGELTVGDTIVTEVLRGVTRWSVTGRRVIDKDDPALVGTPSATLTLTTCWPIRYFGPAPQRLLITAKPIRATPAA